MYGVLHVHSLSHTWTFRMILQWIDLEEAIGTVLSLSMVQEKESRATCPPAPKMGMISMPIHGLCNVVNQKNIVEQVSSMEPSPSRALVVACTYSRGSDRCTAHASEQHFSLRLRHAGRISGRPRKLPIYQKGRYFWGQRDRGDDISESITTYCICVNCKSHICVTMATQSPVHEESRLNVLRTQPHTS